MTLQYYFVMPVDTLTNRGNKLFGAAGSLGENQFPPRPSVLSGAFRSFLLNQSGESPNDLKVGTRLSDENYHKVLGTFHEPGDFALTSLLPACRKQNQINPFLPLPADLMVTDGENEGKNKKVVQALQPQKLPDCIQTSYENALPMLPVLKQENPAKPLSGWLLNQQGIQSYLQGEQIEAQMVVPAADYWRSEIRVGIGLDAQSRSNAESKLFSLQLCVPKQLEHHETETGLVVGLRGTGNLLPEEGVLRLGGDGHAAVFNHINNFELSTFNNDPSLNGIRLVLTTPGIFKNGWLPDRIEKIDQTYRLKLPGFTARLACAAVSRSEVISGWDLANWQPKNAQRAVPSGSVYWFDEIEGDITQLKALSEDGLWPEKYRDQQRNAEGYNQFWLTKWK